MAKIAFVKQAMLVKCFVKCVEYVKITESEECCLTNWAAFYLAEIGFRAKFCQAVGSNLLKSGQGWNLQG